MQATNKQIYKHCSEMSCYRNSDERTKLCKALWWRYTNYSLWLKI